MTARITHVILRASATHRVPTRHRSIVAALRYIRDGGVGGPPYLHGVAAEVFYADGRIVARRFCDPRLLGRARSKIMRELPSV